MGPFAASCITRRTLNMSSGHGPSLFVYLEKQEFPINLLSFCPRSSITTFLPCECRYTDYDLTEYSSLRGERIPITLQAGII